MSIAPILYHYFKTPLPYARTLALQERIHRLQLAQRSQFPYAQNDLLLLLQHRPVYTAGRRQTDTDDESSRLKSIGADFVTTARGGQTTFHGPGQLVGYPLLDLSAYNPTMGIRDYICRMQHTLERHLRENHSIEPAKSEHTGVFIGDGLTKVASIGVQVRHRLTTHGFAINVTREPRAWFDRVVACGLADVRAGSIEDASGDSSLAVQGEVEGILRAFGKEYEREMVPLDLAKEDGELGEAIREMEKDALDAGEWLPSPI